MNIRIFGILLFFLCQGSGLFPAQRIGMDFPHFAGKTYDFIIFQGSSAKTVIQGTIPQDGKFTLEIPKEYTPYTGMSRWLITGTKEGGGLDMVIPGRDFSVSCQEAIPNEKNIIYSGNPENLELNSLYKEQQGILARHNAMLQATRAYPRDDAQYPVFEKQYQRQAEAYESFQQSLAKRNDYPAKFIPIVNITLGMGTRILDSEEKKAKNIADYIAEGLDWPALYTSGHWDGVISSWVGIYTQVLSEPSSFVTGFSRVSKKITNPKQYADFAARAAYALTEQGKDDLIKEIAPIVTASGKISSYDGMLSSYVSLAKGMQAPDLKIPVEKGKGGGNTLLKSSSFAGKGYLRTLLVFYDSGCGACERELKELSGSFKELESKKVRVITISSDKEEAVFKNKSGDFPWKQAYCDYEGMKGVNFRNYGVAGTPTMFLIDDKGKVMLRSATFKEVADALD